jgi:hypothetical protein
LWVSINGMQDGVEGLVRNNENNYLFD